MMYVNETIISPNDHQVVDLKSVQEFLDEHGLAFADAAFRLAGGSASASVFRLIDDVRDAKRLTPSHVRNLQRLHAILVLEDVDHPDRTETALYVDLIPGSRIVDEICLLADRLDDLLVDLGKSETGTWQKASFKDAA